MTYMAPRLSYRDLDACCGTLQELYAETSLEAFPDRLLPMLARLVPCLHVSYNECDLKRNRFFVRLYPERPEVRKLLPNFRAHFNTHPLSEHCRLQNGIPKRISDVATLRQFQQTAIYQKYYRPMGTRHQIVCFFHHKEDLHLGLAWNRWEKDFSRRDVDVVEFLSPHIARAYRHARAAHAMAIRVGTMEDGIDVMGKAVILADAEGQIHWQSSVAREWMEELFPDERTSGRLPRAVSKWLKRMQRSAQTRWPIISEIQTPATRDDPLLVYCGKTHFGDYVLGLVRERASLDLTTGQSFGLTPREAEVLYWISEAKTRPEIARILGISWRTIAKHMDRLFEKLGVENRLEAQRMAHLWRRM
jgi:DNA-binding CsgD family transcriptional regulator